MLPRKLNTFVQQDFIAKYTLYIFIVLTRVCVCALYYTRWSEGDRNRRASYPNHPLLFPASESSSTSSSTFSVTKWKHLLSSEIL